MPRKFDPNHAKAHGYTRADWDAVDAPELTDVDLAQAQPFPEAFPALTEKFKTEIARRGRPPTENPKVAVSIRLDRDLVETMKSQGRGWQTRANALLREALGL